MSSLAVDGPLARTLRFYETTIGKKAIMAVTGFILYGFVIGHLIGNLQIYLGREALNHYAELLHGTKGLLYGARTVLLVSVVLHIVAAVQLAMLKAEARPTGYVKKDNSHSSYASRTMMWSGPILAAFILFHLLHLTTGTAHPDFKELKPYENLVRGFQEIPVAIAYIVAMAMLGTHMYHGVWSMFQSMGLAHPKYTPKFKLLAKVSAVFLFGGNISIPVAIMAGLIK